MKTENKKTARAPLVVLGMVVAMVLSKGLGMVRSMCMAAAYGTGYEANAFSAASRIPLSFFDMLFSAAILGCFIPIYNELKASGGGGGGALDRGKNGAVSPEDSFAVIFLNFILLLTGVLSLVGILFARPIIGLITPGLDGETAALAASLLRIMFPMILFTGAAFTLVGILQSKDHFLLPSLISAISNLGVILYFLLLNDRLGERGIYGLAVAYLFSWALQFLTLAVPLYKMRFPYRLHLNLKDPALRKALRMTPPIMIGSWLAPIGMLCGTYFASEVAREGAVTVFEYAINIYTILTGILTYGICNFTFPKLSRMNVSGDRDSFARTARTAILSALAIVLPVMAAVLILSKEGVSILYLRGAFTAEDAQETARALRYLAPAMPAFCITEIVSRVMYARFSVGVPMVASLLGAGVNILSSRLLVTYCGDILSVSAVTLGNAVGVCVSALVLVIAMCRSIRGIVEKRFLWDLLKLLLLTLLMGTVMGTVYGLLPTDPTDGGLLASLVTCMVTFVPGALLYVGGLKLLRIRFA